MMIVMLLLAIAIVVYPLLRVRGGKALAYKDSNLKLNEEKLKELDLDLKEGRIDQDFYKQAREELDRELLIDIPAENQQNASLHYTGAAKRHPALAIMVAIFIPLMAMLLYLDLGMHSASDENFVAEQQPQSTEQQPSIEEMTKRLEQKIEAEGGSVEEWAMLGRSRKYMGNYDLASKAFAVALEKDTQNAQLMLERAEVMALANERVFNDEAKAIVRKAYALEPDNANAQWFAGVVEYQSENYRNAIDILVKLVPVARDNEDVLNSIIGIIASSRDQLVAAGEEVAELDELLGVHSTVGAQQAATQETGGQAASMTSLNVRVDVSGDVRAKFAEGDTVFIYAKAKQGPRMPLAAQRVSLSQLPAEIVLDDTMAMVEGMNLSSFDQLVVSARVSKSGTAIAQSGDYIGQVDVTDKSSTQALLIMIDTLVP
jgi:cytochrome c-type biogenesis protein CcmH